MAKIKKEQKIIFAECFMEYADGIMALEAAGLSVDYATLYKLLNDNFVNNYIEEYQELAEIFKAKTKDAHIAKLEKLFEEITRYPGADKNYNAAARLSERLEKLKGWDKQENGDKIIVDLKLSKDTDNKAEPISLETSDTRENKVLNHFKKEGLL